MLKFLIVIGILAIAVLIVLYCLFRAALKRERTEYQDPLDLRPIRVEPIAEYEKKQEDG